MSISKEIAMISIIIKIAIRDPNSMLKIRITTHIEIIKSMDMIQSRTTKRSNRSISLDIITITIINMSEWEN